MIESRRAARPTGPSMCSPPLSGPRWTSDALILARWSASAAPRRVAIPQIPHMGRTLWAAPAAGCGFMCGARKDGCGRLAARPAPEDGRLPAGEALLVDELEVEERAHVRLAGRERDCFPEPLRLELRRKRRDGLAAVVAARKAPRHLGLVAVLEIPDVECVPEPPAQDRREPRV